MHIAILGATSHIARDLVRSYASASADTLTLFARRPEAVAQWLQQNGLGGRYAVAPMETFAQWEGLDAVLNFVGVGNPAQMATLGAGIFDITAQYDAMALHYVQQHPGCRYIFLSSGAAYGANFEAPVDQHSMALIPHNKLQPGDWYAVAKLHAECRHRALPELPIVDVRVFNYFSHTQDLEARFLISDMLRAIRDKTVLQTSSDYIVRDYLHPADFFQIVQCVLASPPTNAVADCYSQAPVDKLTLLQAMQERFGLRYVVSQGDVGVHAFGKKPHYYSLNRRMAEFGYQPSRTSLQGVLHEAGLLF